MTIIARASLLALAVVAVAAPALADSRITVTGTSGATVQWDWSGEPGVIRTISSAQTVTAPLNVTTTVTLRGGGHVCQLYLLPTVTNAATGARNCDATTNGGGPNVQCRAPVRDNNTPNCSVTFYLGMRITE